LQPAAPPWDTAKLPAQSLQRGLPWLSQRDLAEPIEPKLAQFNGRSQGALFRKPRVQTLSLLKMPVGLIRLAKLQQRTTQ
tara:strand:+ start:359 stop:598 length:240 start_codon:yes stop_codon:yes gene_type:complete